MRRPPTVGGAIGEPYRPLATSSGESGTTTRRGGPLRVAARSSPSRLTKVWSSAPRPDSNRMRIASLALRSEISSQRPSSSAAIRRSSRRPRAYATAVTMASAAVADNAHRIKTPAVPPGAAKTEPNATSSRPLVLALSSTSSITTADHAVASTMKNVGTSNTTRWCARTRAWSTPEALRHLWEQPAQLCHRVVGRLGSDDRVLREVVAPELPGPQPDHRLAHLEGEPDLRERPELAAYRDHGVRAPRNDHVPRLPESGRDRHGQRPRRRVAVVVRKDADRDAAARGGAAGGGIHDPPEPSAHQHAPRLREPLPRA